MEIDFSKGDGLVPVILQHYLTKQVLMLGYMNEEAYQKTVEEKVCWFYSRSKQRLWKKGESSKNYQYVVDIQTDCDADTLLIFVNPAGPTCHLDTQSCFGDDYFNLNILEETIKNRMKNPEEGSYTKYLMDEGVDKILKKNGEEMTEVIIASKNQDEEELIDEASDLLYHLLVLLNHEGVSLGHVEENLSERHGVKQNYSIRQEIDKW